MTKLLRGRTGGSNECTYDQADEFIEIAHTHKGKTTVSSSKADKSSGVPECAKLPTLSSCQINLLKAPAKTGRRPQ